MTTPNSALLKQAVGGSLKRKFLRLTAADLTAAATSQAFLLPALPAGAIAIGYDINVTTAFVGLTTPTISVGEDGGSATQFSAAVSLAAQARFSQQVAAANSDGNGVTPNITVSAVNNVNNASAGQVDVALIYLEAGEVKTK